MYIINVGIENLSLDDLIKAKELVDYYSDLKKKDIISFTDAKKYEDTFTKVTNNSQELYSRIYSEYEKRVKTIASEKGIDNLDESDYHFHFIIIAFTAIGFAQCHCRRYWYKYLKKMNNNHLSCQFFRQPIRPK